GCQAGPYTYTGSAQTPCSATVTGAGGLSLAPTPSYSGNTNAGTATASYTFSGDANHTGSSDSKTFDITKAASVTAITVTNATYDGSPHGGTAMATGADRRRHVPAPRDLRGRRPPPGLAGCPDRNHRPGELDHGSELPGGPVHLHWRGPDALFGDGDRCEPESDPDAQLREQHRRRDRDSLLHVCW